MKPFIYHAASNEIVQKATIKEPECELSELDANAHPEFAERLIYEWNVYDQHIASLLRRTCHPSCKEVWKDQQEVMEGKDYIIEKLPCEGCSKGYSCYNWQIGDCRDSNNKGTCIPLTQQDSEDELWSVVTEIIGNYEVSLAIDQLKHHFTISRKTTQQ